MTYIILHGAKKNAGDYLIYKRAIKILEKVLDDPEFIIYPRWMNLDHKIKEINETKGIIIPGGPGYYEGFYPKIYTLTTNLDDIKVPVFPMGLGWNGRPMNEPEKFRFTPDSLKALIKFQNAGVTLNTRDIITYNILAQHTELDKNKIVMSGCPAWYDLENLHKEYKPPEEIKNIVFTPPSSVSLAKQSKKLMKRINELFPNAHKYSVFHRGIEPDEFTTKKVSKVYKNIAKYAKKLNYEVVDASYGIDKIQFYRDCDLHIGYRVHASIFFLSIRKPSFLLHEDGRGMGLSQTLNLHNDISAYDKKAIDKIIQNISNESDNNYNSFKEPTKFMENNFEIMKKSILNFQKITSD